MPCGIALRVNISLCITCIIFHCLGMAWITLIWQTVIILLLNTHTHRWQTLIIYSLNTCTHICMGNELCRTFYPWCPCIKSRCLYTTVSTPSRCDTSALITVSYYSRNIFVLSNWKLSWDAKWIHHLLHSLVWASLNVVCNDGVSSHLSRSSEV